MSDAENRRRATTVRNDLESRAVREMGDRMGYGRVMQLCEELWRENLESAGLKGGGEKSVGACVASLVKCPCARPAECDWCCGAGRVTERVAEAMKESP